MKQNACNRWGFKRELHFTNGEFAYLNSRKTFLDNAFSFVALFASNVLLCKVSYQVNIDSG